MPKRKDEPDSEAEYIDRDENSGQINEKSYRIQNGKKIEIAVRTRVENPLLALKISKDSATLKLSLNKQFKVGNLSHLLPFPY